MYRSTNDKNIVYPSSKNVNICSDNNDNNEDNVGNIETNKSP